MEREQIARERRRHQAREYLEFEREREAALRDRLADVITEQLGAQVDETAFLRMSPDEVEVVREALVGRVDADEEDEADEDVVEWPDDFEDVEEDADEAETEIARLEAELAACRGRQQAYERYLEALAEGT